MLQPLRVGADAGKKKQSGVITMAEYSMNIKDVVDMLSYGTRFKLIGARTGKVLHDSRKNTTEHLDKFKCCQTWDNPLFVELDGYKNGLGHYEQMIPVLCIWVSGK